MIRGSVHYLFKRMQIDVRKKIGNVSYDYPTTTSLPGQFQAPGIKVMPTRFGIIHFAISGRCESPTVHSILRLRHPYSLELWTYLVYECREC